MCWDIQDFIVGSVVGDDQQDDVIVGYTISALQSNSVHTGTYFVELPKVDSITTTHTV